MIRAIVWKEFREQGLIGLTLMVLGSGILVAAATLADPPTPGAGPTDVIRFLGAGMLATLLLSVTAGTVCGGALFAAEREAGTMGFLEALPVSRWRLWRAKLLAGVLLVAIEVGFLLAVAAGLGLFETSASALAIATYSLLAFVWGLFGSTLARTTLGSVGIAVPASALAAVLYYLPIGLFYHNPRTNLLQAEGGALYLGLMAMTPLLGSAFRFTRNDRDRAADDPTTTPHPTPREADIEERSPNAEEFASPRPRFGIKALLWLAIRQLIKPGLVIAGFMLFLGFALLVESIQPVIVWPALALTAGMLAGVTAFVDEQSNGSARYWGECRLPVGRLWSVKIGVHAVFAVLLAVLLLLPSAIRAEAEAANMVRGGSFLSIVFRTLLFDGAHLGSQGWKFLFLPLVYGFAVGHLCGLLFRKAVVAAGVAGLVGGTAAAFWLPSIFTGGVWNWQFWLPPAIVLLTARLLLRAWSADRIATRPTLTTLAGGLIAALLVLAAGLGYRVLEVHDDPTSEDDQTYVTGLPPLEANDSGRQFRSAAERFTRVSQSIPPLPKQPGLATGAGGPRGNIEELIASVPYRGWNVKDPDLDDWITKVFENDETTGQEDEAWHEQAEKAGREKATGIFEHPLRTGSTASLLTQSNGRRMGTVLLAHGLQKQSAGDPGRFPSDLRTVLALGRSFRNGSVVVALGFGNDLARYSFSATDCWLATLHGRPDLIRETIRALQDDEPAGPFDPRPHILAERYLLRELLKAPGQFLPAQITPPGRDREQLAPLVDLIGVAWNVPWERERTRRLLGIAFDVGNPYDANRYLIRGRPSFNLFTSRGLNPNDMIENDRLLRTHRRAVVIELAIRIFQTEKGASPRALEELVSSGCLPAVPLDPYDDRPFRYRISPGEVLPANQAAAMSMGLSIPAGQIVLWSVGPDRTDDGGRNAASRPGSSTAGADIVFLVPPAPAKP